MMQRGCKYRENRVVNCSSRQIRIQKTLWAILHRGRLGKTFYRLADIDEKSVSLEIFINSTEVSFRDILVFASEENWIKTAEKHQPYNSVISQSFCPQFQEGIL